MNEVDVMVSLTKPNGETYSYAFDVGSRVSSLSRPGSITTPSFDSSGALMGLLHQNSGGTTLASFGITRESDGKVSQIQTQSFLRQFGYDADSQLISSSNTELVGGFAAETFGYDSIANRRTDQGGAYLYDSKSQRLTEDYRFLYFYDLNGNLIKKQEKQNFPLGQVTNYSYTSENQLRVISFFENGSLSPSKEVTYLYDVLGRRVQKQVIDHANSHNSFMRRFIYDGQDILLEYDGSNRLLARYAHAPHGSDAVDDVLSVDVTSDGAGAGLAQSSGSYQYLKDHQGTVTDITDVLSGQG